MSDRDNHTTIRVRNEVRDKIKQLQDGTDLTISDVLENLLQNRAGTIVDDVENIHREDIAYELEYFDGKSAKRYYLTYKEIARSDVGDKWYANAFISAKEYQTEEAEVIFKDKDSAFIRLTQRVVENDSERMFQSMIHISLF